MPVRYVSDADRGDDLAERGGVAQRPEHQEVHHQAEQHRHSSARMNAGQNADRAVADSSIIDRDVQPVGRQEVEPREA